MFAEYIGSTEQKQCEHGLTTVREQPKLIFFILDANVKFIIKGREIESESTQQTV